MEFLQVAIDSARKAGQIHKKYFRKNVTVKSKSHSYDLLTDADIASEKAIVAHIRRFFPTHNILAEEGTYKATDSEYTWIIDPLDGTNNFACGLPIFCASVACVYKNEVIAGAVYDLTRDELFYGQKGKGAFLNAKPITVNDVSVLKKALLITGFYYDRGAKMIETLETIKRFHLKRIVGVRRLGAAALDLCYVACGRAAGFWEFELSPWDFAAGKLIIEEAGGRVTGDQGEPVPVLKKYFIVASNGLLHRKMLRVINA